MHVLCTRSGIGSSTRCTDGGLDGTNAAPAAARDHLVAALAAPGRTHDGDELHRTPVDDAHTKVRTHV